MEVARLISLQTTCVLDLKLLGTCGMNTLNSMVFSELLTISHKDYIWKSFWSNEEVIFIANSFFALDTSCQHENLQMNDFWKSPWIIHAININHKSHSNSISCSLSFDPSSITVIETWAILTATPEIVCLNASSPAPSSRRRERHTSGEAGLRWSRGSPSYVRQSKFLILGMMLSIPQ